MYLQSLELFGFKSFVARTVLNFHSGVTAIVGPNGCGKSNVLDAMRWVLGEQSAKALRGGEMADVIFSGTDARPAVGMAEVSMTFAECEKELGVQWNEVRITRRVYRDGNSEYFLNKTPCRLKDIHQLFMDTGIGRSAYSIMEQGKIDLILSSKPEDRRAIFEEAAGITKFKSQRKEALRKLEYTEANLLRLADIIKEVKRQIGSLQRQAGKARRYQLLASDLRTLETHLARRQFDELDASAVAAQVELDRLRDVRAAQEAEIETQEAGATAQRHSIGEMESELGAARQDLQDIRNHIGNAENRIAFNQERIRESTALAERYEQDIQGAEEKLKAQQDQIETTDLELAEISAGLLAGQGRLEEKMEAASQLSGRRIETEKALQDVFNAITKVETQLESIRHEFASHASARDAEETRIRIIDEEIQQLASAAERGSARQASLSRELAQAESGLSEGESRERASVSAAIAIAGESDEIKRQIAAEERKLAERESKLELLRQLNAEGEGFSEGAQAVLRGLDNPEFFKPAIGGALASLLTVEQRFVPAIEAALGANLQLILLKDVEMAASVLQTLSSQKLGRASLAPRGFLAPGHPPAGDPLPEGGIAWAADCAGAPAELQPLVSSLLHDTAIVADLDAAVRLKRQWGHLAFVTLAGEAISKEGIIHGGVIGEGNSGSILLRKAQIASLDEEVSAIRLNLGDIEARRQAISEQLESAEAAREQAREESRRLAVALSTLKNEMASAEREMGETEAKAAARSAERERMEQLHREAIAKIGELETRAAECRQELSGLQSRQGTLQGELEELRQMEAALTSELNEMRVSVATEKQRHASLAERRHPMAARLEELDELIAQRRADIEDYRNRAANLGAESARIAAEIETAKLKSAGSEERVAALVEQRASLAASVESLESTLRILRRQLSECHDQRSQQEVKQTQIQLRIENLAEHISRRYQIDLRSFSNDFYTLHCTLRDQQKRQRKLESAGEPGDPEAASVPETAEPEPAPEIEEPLDWERIELLVKELDQRLESMGPVNVEAINEYDELEARYSFLEKQSNDLDASKKELLDVIAKINDTTRKLFAETFESVRINFQEMFVELFGGGKANLLLVDESDPLESGIEIVAKPPGKQLQSISLLSGGEKTMTAVSLLFAIYMVKPSPFCVLDEMDAPLDESNINRFIKILDRFVTQSQFVVISHNKRTIAKADALYGVTMEEQGISKLVGVKFARREESHSGSDIIGTSNAAAVPSVAETFGKSSDLHSEQLQAG